MFIFDFSIDATIFTYGAIPASFSCLFSFFSHQSSIMNLKSIDVVLGIQSQGQ